jgi:hypothetical protein
VKHEQAIRLNAKLYEVRDTARKVLGDSYRARMAEGGRMLSEMAEAKKCGVLEVALNVSQSAARKDDMNAVTFILAAAVELLEPSEDAG